MVRASLNNPYAVAAIALIIVILGAVSYQNMVEDIFPEINIPVVAIATFYKGMGPSEIEGAITLRLEQLYSKLPTSSTSSRAPCRASVSSKCTSNRLMT